MTLLQAPACSLPACVWGTVHKIIKGQTGILEIYVKRLNLNPEVTLNSERIDRWGLQKCQHAIFKSVIFRETIMNRNKFYKISCLFPTLLCLHSQNSIQYLVFNLFGSKLIRGNCQSTTCMAGIYLFGSKLIRGCQSTTCMAGIYSGPLNISCALSLSFNH